MSAVEVIAARPASRRRSIDRHLTSAYARDRIATALYAVLVDAVEFGPCRLRAEDDREWVREAVAAPLQASTEAALATLRRELDRVFDRAPAEIIAWLETATD